MGYFINLNTEKDVMLIKVEKRDGGRLLLNADFAEILEFNGISSFEKIWNITSEPVKKVVKQRGTERVFLKSPDSTPQAKPLSRRLERVECSC
jgi:hypothetical protein